VIGRGSLADGEETRVLMVPEDVRALPEVTYTAGDVEDRDLLLQSSSPGRVSYFENTACSICLEDFEEGETLRLLPCKHAYHLECVEPWLCSQQASCPLCKADVLTDAQKAEKRSARTRRRTGLLDDIVSGDGDHGGGVGGGGEGGESGDVRGEGGGGEPAAAEVESLATPLLSSGSADSANLV
jgi:hypothetical protein